MGDMMQFAVAGGRQHSITLKAGDTLTVSLLVAPGPGEECELCHEDAPSENALRMRAWRQRRKSKPRPRSGSGTHGTEEKR